MMEWQLNLQAGKATVHVEFKGGFENEYGIHPATFMTKDPIVQTIIERSSYFACGKIVLLESKNLGMSAEEIAKAKRRADAQAKRLAEAKAKDAEANAEEAHEKVSDEPSDDGDTYDAGNDNEPSDDVPADAETSTDGGEESAEEMEVVKVSCNQDAKDYLEEHFGAQPYLRNWDTILATGKANGILFVKE